MHALQLVDFAVTVNVSRKYATDRKQLSTCCTLNTHAEQRQLLKKKSQARSSAT